MLSFVMARPDPRHSAALFNARTPGSSIPSGPGWKTSRRCRSPSRARARAMVRGQPLQVPDGVEPRARPQPVRPPIDRRQRAAWSWARRGTTCWGPSCSGTTTGSTTTTASRLQSEDVGPHLERPDRRQRRPLRDGDHEVYVRGRDHHLGLENASREGEIINRPVHKWQPSWGSPRQGLPYSA